MHNETFEVVTHAENAMCYGNQALSMLEIWLEGLGRSDEYQSNRVGAIHTLVHEAVEHLKKAVEVSRG